MTSLPYESRALVNGLFLLLVFIAATNYIAVKWALEEVPPFTLMAIRYLLAALIITALVLPNLSSLSKELLKASLLAGGVLTLAAVCWQFGMLEAEHIGPGAFVVSMDGLMVPLFAALFLKEHLGVRVLLALPLALAGLALLNLRSGTSLVVSDLWFIISAVGFALHILLTHRLSRLHDAVCLAWGQMWVVALITVMAAAYFEYDALSLAGITAVKYEILYLAVVATALRFSLQNFLQKRMSAARAGLLFVLEPVVVALLGWFVLDEVMSLQQLFGCVLIFIAVLMSQTGAGWNRQPASGKEPDLLKMQDPFV